MTNEEYVKALEEEVFPKVISSGGMPPEVKSYFHGHYQRFEAQLNMFRDHLTGQHIKTVYDIGTGTPFASYYWNVTEDALVIYGSPIKGLAQINQKCFGIYINLCSQQPMGPADLVICTECLEHLPCNVYGAYFYLSSLVRPGGYLLASFPLGGARACEYERDDLGDHNGDHSGHFREFTEQTARDFYKVNGFKLIAEYPTYTQAYGNTILNVLLRRPDGSQNQYNVGM